MGHTLGWGTENQSIKPYEDTEWPSSSVRAVKMAMNISKFWSWSMVPDILEYYWTYGHLHKCTHGFLCMVNKQKRLCCQWCGEMVWRELPTSSWGLNFSQNYSWCPNERAVLWRKWLLQKELYPTEVLPPPRFPKPWPYQAPPPNCQDFPHLELASLSNFPPPPLNSECPTNL